MPCCLGTRPVNNVARLAEQTGVYHPYDNDPLLQPQNRPSVFIPPQALRQWITERDELFAQRRRQLAGKPTLEVEYERLVGNWDSELVRLHQFLGVAPLLMEPAKRKQETRSLWDVVVNYDELQMTMPSNL